MKVNTIRNTVTTNRNSSARSNEPKYCLNTVNIGSGVNFKGYGAWIPERLNILNRSEAELKDLAEYFHRESDATIREASAIKKFFGKDNELSQRAYEKLSSAVEKVKKYKNGLTSNQEITRLNDKSLEVDSKFRKWHDDGNSGDSNSLPWEITQYP